MNNFFLMTIVFFSFFSDLFAMKERDNRKRISFTIGKVEKKEKKQKQKPKKNFDEKRLLSQNICFGVEDLEQRRGKKSEILFQKNNEREEDELINLFTYKTQCSESEESVIISLFQDFKDEKFDIVCKKMLGYAEEQEYSSQKKSQFFQKAIRNFFNNSMFSDKSYFKDFFMYCIQHKIFEMIELCLHFERFEVLTYQLDFLNQACQYNNSEALRIFIDYGMDINVQDELYDSTPLFTAVTCKSIDCIKILLSNKNINIDVLDSINCKAQDYIDKNDLHILNLFEEFSKKSKQQCMDDSDDL